MQSMLWLREAKSKEKQFLAQTPFKHSTASLKFTMLYKKQS